ncbi:MAG: baseplate J/gp47 family protein [Lachnospiraceae bacterium]|nr:baseplate J/gp47 family protein [Lachnospiraceae bacterium]
MLPDIHLDRTSFDEMVERAKNRIVSIYPEWTDFNYHDPGITLIELFAWRKEIQQYELDHIGESHRRKYLQLLGTDIKHRTPAQCFVTAEPSAPCLIQEGCRLEAAGVIFETKDKQMLPGVSIKCCLGWLEDMISFLDGDRLALGGPFQFYPFGSMAREGTCLYIGLSGPLPVGENVALTIQVDRQGGFPRNPACKDSIPLGKLDFSYWDGTQYQSVKLIREETFGLLFDGQIVFRVNSLMQECKIGNEDGYFLRVLLKESQYEAPPAISFLDMNTLRVKQKETVAKWLAASGVGPGDIIWGEHNLCAMGEVRVFAEQQGCYREIPVLSKEVETATGRTRIRLKQSEVNLFDAEAFWILAYIKEDWYIRHSVLGIGHGFPNECFELEDFQGSYEDLELLIEAAERPGLYQKWEKREDFSGSGPEDEHYCVDSITGRILFGNGIHGMAPEGQVLLASYARILGSGGNIKAARIQHLQNQSGEEIKAVNRWDACGGQNEETVEEAFVRVRRELMQPKNLVTAQDYEQMVTATPGLCVESCKALFLEDRVGKETGQTVKVVVKPYSPNSRPGLTPAFIQNILRHLEKKRLLGVRIKVISPIYIKLSVLVETAVHPQYQDAEGMVEQAVKEYLANLTEQFGTTVSYSNLYGYIDRLDCVAGIRSLMLEADGNEVKRNSYGDLIFPGNGIADEIYVQCLCSIV